jgi:subtilisin family serine protease
MKRLWLLLVLLAPVIGAEVVPNRYIVELTGEPAAEEAIRMAAPGQRKRALRSAAADQRRARIRAEQRAARQLLEGEGASIVDSVETVANALVVRMPDARAARLAGLPGVRRVHPVRRFRKALDHALPLHKVTDGWGQVGIENAGAGIKIGIIDTGIDIEHPGFQDPSLPLPEGYPKVNDETDVAFTNTKVIVARSYSSYFEETDPDPSARDRDGHGSGVAMAAAGVRNAGPLAIITGVAPKAWLGAYKVFGSPGVNDTAPEDAILKAIDDAIADGMDVLNLSLGDAVAPRQEFDPEVLALERAAALGVIVVVAAGNVGPDANTIASPATAPSVIAVGASANDRVFFTSASVTGGGPYRAVPGTGPAPATPVSARLVDVAVLDQTGLACDPLPPDSLSGSIAFILRGTCYFELKLTNAQQAGAVGALVYTHQEDPNPFTMAVGEATLPAVLVSHPDGIEIKGLLSQQVEATLRFTPGPVYSDPNRLASFSSKGPNGDLSVKPDIVAVGTTVYTAAERTDPNGNLYNLDGYVAESGTSFSAPLVAGAAAVLKAARPGLTVAQYRSLLINTASPAWLAPGTQALVQQAGAGALDLSAALRATAAAAPALLSFGSGSPDAQISRNLTIANVGTAAETFLLSAVPRDGSPAPALSHGSLELEPGASAELSLDFTAAGLQPGQYEGFIAVQGTASGIETHIPYWYAVPSGIPHSITVLSNRADDGSVKPGDSVNSAVYFRVLDASGLHISDIEPVVTVISGEGEVLRVRSLDARVPGAFSFGARMGPHAGRNVFRIQAGEVTREVSILTH